MRMGSVELQKTPLAGAHERLGARLIDFGGWWMPLHYPAGILAEHHATRNAVGVFDVSHMGEIHFRGPRAPQAVQRLVTNDIGKLYDGRAMYTVACHPTGGIVDDLIVYRVDSEHFMAIVNASNTHKDFRWFLEQAGEGCSIVDASNETGLIAYQGPKAEATLQTVTKTSLAGLRSFHFQTGVVLAGREVWIARTGYTGEDGFEIVCHSADAEFLWEALVNLAKSVGGSPAGLGARDTLRLEARLPLYGNDLDDTTTPFEAGLDWVVKLDAGDFIGRAALLEQKARGIPRKLVGLCMEGRGIARHGYALTGMDGRPLGFVTSGTVGPTVGKNIALGYVPTAEATPGHRVLVDCRGKAVPAVIVEGPFYKRPALKPKI